MKKSQLLIKNFYAGIDGKEILKGIDLTIKQGEVHAIMGPNGAGKTTLAMSLMGNPSYNIKFQIPNFKFQINEKDLFSLSPENRAKLGLFVSFQNPVEIQGVSMLSFLRTAYKALHKEEQITLSAFKEEVKKALQAVHLPEDFMRRNVNEGFSGGEKKRAEIAQLMVLKPKFVILDEIDSGLDIDSLRFVAKTIQQVAKTYNMGILLITHYQRILHYLKPDMVHVLIDGKIKTSGDMDLVNKIEEKGYAEI